MTEKPVRWFEGFPEVIKRGEEQDNFFLALAATLASEVPFAEIEEPEMAEEVENQLEEEPVARRAWQPDPSWHRSLDNQLDHTSTDEIIATTIELLDLHFYKAEQVEITEVAIRYATEVTQSNRSADQEAMTLEKTTEECIQELHSAIDGAIDFKLLTDSLESGEEVGNSVPWNEYYTLFGEFGVILTLATIFDQLDNVQISKEAISVVGKTTFPIHKISMLPGKELVGKVEGRGSTKSLIIKLATTEDATTLTCVSDHWILRQHPDWYNFIQSGNISGVSIQFSLMAGAEYDAAGNTSKSKKSTFCRLSAHVTLENAKAEPLVLELPVSNKASILEMVETFFSFFVPPGINSTKQNQERIFAAQS